MAKGPDFSLETIRTLAKRAGEVCSKPGCLQGTSGGHTDPTRVTNLGEAAHIRGARKQPNNRYDPNMTDEERSHITNGIWLCRLHAREIDTDEEKFTVELLLEWKDKHEKAILNARRETAAMKEIQVKEGVGEINANSGSGTALEIVDEGDGSGPTERIVAVDGGVGAINVNTGSGTAKRIVRVR